MSNEQLDYAWARTSVVYVFPKTDDFSGFKKVAINLCDQGIDFFVRLVGDEIHIITSHKGLDSVATTCTSKENPNITYTGE